MGDRTPAQLLCDLKRIMGTCSPHDETITRFLKTAFFNRLPANVQSILAAFDSHPLDLLPKLEILLSLVAQSKPPTQFHLKTVCLCFFRKYTPSR